MSFFLGNGRPQSYMGVEADTPPNVKVFDRAPTIYDINFNLGDIWIHKYVLGGSSQQDIYMLTCLEGTSMSKGDLATWALIGSGDGDLVHLTAQDGNVAHPIAGNINIVGDGVNVFTTSVLPGTITISYDGDPGETFITNSGNAIPDVGTGEIRVLGGTNMHTRASAADAVTIDMNDNVVLAGYLDAAVYVYSRDYIEADNGVYINAGGLTVTAGGINATGAITFPSLTNGFALFDGTGVVSASTGGGGLGGWIPIANAAGNIVWGQLQQGAGVTITNAGNVVTIAAGGGGGGGADTFITDVDSPAIIAGTAISILGNANNIVTDGTTANTVTVSLRDDVTINNSLTVTALGGVPGIVQVDATGLLSANGGLDGQVLIGNTATGIPVWATLTAGVGIAIANAGGSITITNTGGGGAGGIVQITTDAGTAVQDGANNINLYGTANQITSTAAPINSVTLSLSNTLQIPGTLTFPLFNYIGVLQTTVTGEVTSTVGTNGQVLISGGTGPVWRSITAGTGIAITSVNPNEIIITNTASGAGALVFHTQDGDANAVGGRIVINGGENINTDGATDTVVVNLNRSVVLPATTADALNGVYGIGTTVAPSLPVDRFLHSYGYQNVFCGHGSGNFTLTTATSRGNTGVGRYVLRALGLGAYNSALGSNVLWQNVDGNYNTGVGSQSLYEAISSYNSTFGAYSLRTLSTGEKNTAAGAYSSYILNTGDNVVSVGYRSLYHALASNNTAVGSDSGLSATTATELTLVGRSAGAAITTADSSTLIGYQSGLTLTGKDSTFVGASSGVSVTSGYNNVLIGKHAGYSTGFSSGLTTGHDNVFIGNEAGEVAGAYNNSICIGNYTQTQGTGSIVIGRDSVSSYQTSFYAAGIWGRAASVYSRLVFASAVTNQVTGLCKLTTTDPAGNQGLLSGSTLIGGANGPVWNRLTPGFGIQITNTDNHIEIARSEGDIVAFLAYHNGTNNNITGDGTTVWFGAFRTLTEVTDSHAAFYPGNGAGTNATFTAPYTGMYTFTVQIYYVYTAPPVPPPAPVTYYDPIIIENVTQGKSYEQNMPFITTNPENQTGCYTIVTKLTLNDVIRFGFSATLDPSSLRLGVFGSDSTETYIAGYLVKQL